MTELDYDDISLILSALDTEEKMLGLGVQLLDVQQRRNRLHTLIKKLTPHKAQIAERGKIRLSRVMWKGDSGQEESAKPTAVSLEEFEAKLREACALTEQEVKIIGFWPLPVMFKALKKVGLDMSLKEFHAALLQLMKVMRNGDYIMEIQVANDPTFPGVRKYGIYTTSGWLYYLLWRH